MADPIWRKLKNSDSEKIKNTTVFCVKFGIKILLFIFSLRAAILESKMIKVWRRIFDFIYYLFIYLTPEIHSLTYKNTSLCTLADYHISNYLYNNLL